MLTFHGHIEGVVPIQDRLDDWYHSQAEWYLQSEKGDVYVHYNLDILTKSAESFPHLVSMHINHQECLENYATFYDF